MISITMSLLFFRRYSAIMVFAQVALLSPQGKHVLSHVQLFDMLSESSFVCQRRKKKMFSLAHLCLMDAVLSASFLFFFFYLS